MTVGHKGRASGQAAAAAVTALVLLTVAWQSVAYREALTGPGTVAHLQPYTDGEDYLGRARRLADGDGFAAVFRDGLRTPGYPLFLTLFAGAGDDQAQAARFAQILLSSSLIVIAFLAISSITGGRVLPLAGAAAAALWIPFHYFSPVLYAETTSLVLVGLLCLLLARFDPAGPLAALIPASAVLAAAVYLKPNHIALLPALVVFAAYATRRAGRPVPARTVLVPVLGAAILIAPWSAFLSSAQGSFMPLSTNGGWNLYIGAGGSVDTPPPWARGTLISKAWGLLDLGDTTVTREAYGSVPVDERAEMDRELRRLALERWKARPAALSLYGAAKVLHSFGFSMRGPRDWAVLLHTAAAAAASIVLWRRRRHREWAVLLWMIAAAVAAQAFLFLGELRFKTVPFDFPALIVIVLGLGDLVRGAAGPAGGGAPGGR